MKKINDDKITLGIWFTTFRIFFCHIQKLGENLVYGLYSSLPKSPVHQKKIEIISKKMFNTAVSLSFVTKYKIDEENKISANFNRKFDAKI